MSKLKANFIRMKSPMRRTAGVTRLVCVAALLWLPWQVGAQSLNARFSTSMYSWERQLTDSLSQSHFRIYQTARITVGQLAGNRLSFHLYAQASQDIASSAEDDPIPRLYNAYLQWSERKGVVQRIRLGRQRIYSGVAYGTIDGVDLTVRAGKRFKIGGFAGFLVSPANEVEVTNWDEGHAFGLHVGANNLFGTKVLLSFMQRNRRPLAYQAPGRYTQKLLEFNSLEQRLVGLDVYRKLTDRIIAYGRLDYDIEQERVRRGQVELKVAASDRLELSGEFFHRAPLLDAQSIFTVFGQGTTQDFLLRANYRFAQGWSVSGNAGMVLYDGDESVRFGLGVRCKYGSAGYTFRRGYGGQNNGLYASLSYPLTSNLGLLASTGLSRYSLFDENGNGNTSLTGSLGLNYRAGNHFSFDFLGQGVRNRFYDNDMRVFVKANYWVFSKL